SRPRHPLVWKSNPPLSPFFKGGSFRGSPLWKRGVRGDLYPECNGNYVPNFPKQDSSESKHLWQKLSRNFQANSLSPNPATLAKTARGWKTRCCSRERWSTATTFVLRVCCTLQFYAARTPMLGSSRSILRAPKSSPAWRRY